MLEKLIYDAIQSKIDNYSTIEGKKKVIYNLLESIRSCAVLLQAFLPDTANSIFNQINTDIIDLDSTKRFGILSDEFEFNEPSVLFQRITHE